MFLAFHFGRLLLKSSHEVNGAASTSASKVCRTALRFIVCCLLALSALSHAVSLLTCQRICLIGVSIKDQTANKSKSSKPGTKSSSPSPKDASKKSDKASVKKGDHAKKS